MKLLATKDMSAAELAQILSLKTITVRHHLNMLKLLGMIREASEQRGKVGRPIVRYHATQKPISVEFPRRHYEIISNILLQGLIRNLGPQKTKTTLWTMGHEFGSNLARELTSKHGVERWDMRMLKKYFVELHLDGMGAVPEIVEVTGQSVRYRIHNCVLSELAREHPDLVCGGFDDGLLDGLLKSTIPRAQAKQLRCVGRGDGFCEYVLYTVRPE